MPFYEDAPPRPPREKLEERQRETILDELANLDEVELLKNLAGSQDEAGSDEGEEQDRDAAGKYRRTFNLQNPRYKDPKKTPRELEKIDALPVNMVEQLLWKNVTPPGRRLKPNENVEIVKCPWIFKSLTSRTILAEKPDSEADREDAKRAVVELFSLGDVRPTNWGDLLEQQKDNEWSLKYETAELATNALYKAQDAADPLDTNIGDRVQLLLKWAVRSERGKTLTLDLTKGLPKLYFKGHLNDDESMVPTSMWAGGTSNGVRTLRTTSTVVGLWYQDLRPNGNPAYCYRYYSKEADWRQNECSNRDIAKVVQQWEPASKQHRAFYWNGVDGSEPSTKTRNDPNAAYPWYVQRMYVYELLDPKGVSGTCDPVPPDYPTSEYGFNRKYSLMSEGPEGPWKSAGTDKDKVDDTYRRQPWKYQLVQSWWKNTSYKNAYGSVSDVGAREYGQTEESDTKAVDFTPDDKQTEKRKNEIKKLLQLAEETKTTSNYKDPTEFADEQVGKDWRQQYELMVRRLLRAGVTPYGGWEEFEWHRASAGSSKGTPLKLKKKIWCGNGTKLADADDADDADKEEKTIEDKVRGTHFLRWKWIEKTVKHNSNKGNKLDTLVIPGTSVVLVDLGASAPVLFDDANLRPVAVQVQGRGVQVRQLEQSVKWETWNWKSDQEKRTKEDDLAKAGVRGKKQAIQDWKNAYGIEANRDKDVLEIGDFLKAKKTAKASKHAGTTLIVRTSATEKKVNGSVPGKPMLTPTDASMLPFLREGDVVYVDGRSPVQPDENSLSSIPYIFEPHDPKDKINNRMNDVLESSKLPNNRFLTKENIEKDLKVVFFPTIPSLSSQSTQGLNEEYTAADLDLLNRPRRSVGDSNNEQTTPSIWRMSNFVNYTQLRRCYMRSSEKKGEPNQICAPPYKNADKAVTGEQPPQKSYNGVGVGPLVNTNEARDEYKKWQADVEYYSVFTRYNEWYEQLDKSSNVDSYSKVWNSNQDGPGVLNGSEELTTNELETVLGLSLDWKTGKDRDEGKLYPPPPPMPPPIPPQVPEVRGKSDPEDAALTLKMKPGTTDGTHDNDWKSVPLSIFEDESFMHIWNKLCAFPSPDSSSGYTANKPPAFVQVGQPKTDGSGSVSADTHAHAYVLGYAIYDKKEYDTAKREYRIPEEGQEAARKTGSRKEAKAAAYVKKDKAENERRDAAEKRLQLNDAARKDLATKQGARTEARTMIRNWARRNPVAEKFSNLPKSMQNVDDNRNIYRDLTDEQWWREYCADQKMIQKPYPAPDGMLDLLVSGLFKQNGIRFENVEDFERRLKAWQDTSELQDDKYGFDDNPSIKNSATPNFALAASRQQCQPWKPERHEAGFRVYASIVGAMQLEAEQRNAEPGNDALNEALEKMAQCSRLIGERVDPESDDDYRKRFEAWTRYARCLKRKEEEEPSETIPRVPTALPPRTKGDTYSRQKIQQEEAKSLKRDSEREAKDRIILRDKILHAEDDAAADKLRADLTRELDDAISNGRLDDVDVVTKKINAADKALAQRGRLKVSEFATKRTELEKGEESKKRARNAKEMIDLENNILAAKTTPKARLIKRSVEQRLKAAKKNKYDKDNIPFLTKLFEVADKALEQRLEDAKKRAAAQARNEENPYDPELVNLLQEALSKNGNEDDEDEVKDEDDEDEVKDEDDEEAERDARERAAQDVNSDSDEDVNSDSDDGSPSPKKPARARDPMVEAANFTSLERVRWRVLGGLARPDKAGWYSRLGYELAKLGPCHLLLLEHGLDNHERAALRRCVTVTADSERIDDISCDKSCDISYELAAIGTKVPVALSKRQ